ncbi:U6 snRNA-associated Sm-like protein LSm2 isoform X1 [Tachypleus tridentatus]|uniref:U6 snRNA-associated Sm-like protein LSm2 isoform X1 n=1 Tax=Tachypleus tridentatus TaxID=6853 RepID=UPI003FD029FC
MLFYSFFKSLVGKDVVVELKNDLSICGTLHSVDQYLNIKLTDISLTDPEKYPHMLLKADVKLTSSMTKIDLCVSVSVRLELTKFTFFESGIDSINE